MRKTALALLAILLIPAGIRAASVGLKWDQVTEPGVVGVNVYVSTAPVNATGKFPNPTKYVLLNVANFNPPNLNNGTLYFFAVTAYNTEAESDYSNVVSWMSTATPTPSPSPTPTPSPTPSPTITPSPTPSPSRPTPPANLQRVTPTPSPTPTATATAGHGRPQR